MKFKFNWAKFGKELKSLRVDAEIGLREVCRDTGVDKAAWSRAENGKPISVPNLLALCVWMGSQPFQYFSRR